MSLPTRRLAAAPAARRSRRTRSASVAGVLGGLLVAALRLCRPAAQEQLLGQRARRAHRRAGVAGMVGGPHEGGPGVGGDAIEALAPRVVARLPGQRCQLVAAPVPVAVVHGVARGRSSASCSAANWRMVSSAR